MGWDAFAITPKMITRKNAYWIKDKRVRAEFRRAFATVKAKGYAPDGFLDGGGLDCSTCREMLERATGGDCHGPDWTPDQVVAYYEAADWSFKIDQSEAWAYYSAAQFLAVCARYRLGIEFSW